MPRMNRHWPLHAIAWVTLLLGGVVYFYARPDSLFASGQALYTPLTGQLPSFLHTLAFALACALVP
ncbi:MAG: hypothetical protein OEQ74_08255, partial [Gammaproteobacteria bacterium]|nr:hypothetical protein [Gammaproteobacteria bacterium]